MRFERQKCVKMFATSSGSLQSSPCPIAGLWGERKEVAKGWVRTTRGGGELLPCTAPNHCHDSVIVTIWLMWQEHCLYDGPTLLRLYGSCHSSMSVQSLTLVVRQTLEYVCCCWRARLWLLSSVVASSCGCSSHDTWTSPGPCTLPLHGSELPESSPAQANWMLPTAIKHYVIQGFKLAQYYAERHYLDVTSSRINE